MEINPYIFNNKLDEPTLIYTTVSENIGKSEITASCLNFNDECFVLADALKNRAHSETACKLASETSIWGYKLIRQRKFYWADKKLLVKRIFRSVNIAVWQKQRESGFESGIATSLAVAIFGPENIWMGTVGDIQACIYRSDQLILQSKIDTDESGKILKTVGVNRFGLIPQLYIQKFIKNDTLILAVQSLSNFISKEEIGQIVSKLDKFQESLNMAAKQIIKLAKLRGFIGSLAVCMVRRID
jgi:serine/threonine protein phosphatase PrpC